MRGGQSRRLMSGSDGVCTHAVRAGASRSHLGSVGDLGKAWWMEWPIDVSEGLWGVGRRQSTGSSAEEEKIPVRSPPGLGRYSERSSRQRPGACPSLP